MLIERFLDTPLGVILPELIKDLRVGFLYHGSITTAIVQDRLTIRSGTAVCSEKDTYDQWIGEKVALKRALKGFDYGIKNVVWLHILGQRDIVEAELLDAEYATLIHRKRGGQERIFVQNGRLMKHTGEPDRRNNFIYLG